MFSNRFVCRFLQTNMFSNLFSTRLEYRQYSTCFLTGYLTCFLTGSAADLSSPVGSWSLFPLWLTTLNANSIDPIVQEWGFFKMRKSMVSIESSLGNKENQWFLCKWHSQSIIIHDLHWISMGNHWKPKIFIYVLL